MSGTSMAAAVTTGVVALMLQSDPALAPDDVKCRLLASARPAVTANGTLAYSVFQQGAGLINAVSAVNSSATGCANRGPQHRRRSRGHAALRRPRQRRRQRQLLRHEHGGLDLGRLDAVGRLFLVDRLRRLARATPGARATSGARRIPGTRPTPGPMATPGARATPGRKATPGAKSVPWWSTSTSTTGTAQPASIESWVPNE